MDHEIRAKKSARRKVLRNDRRKWLYEYLLGHPCVDCGETDPVVLEFDHRRGDKEIEISRAVNNWSLPRLCEEITKCDVLCANCHARRTAVDHGWLSATLHYLG